MSQYVPEQGRRRRSPAATSSSSPSTPAAKPREQWRIGTEYEKVAVRRADGRAVPFSGPRGIEALLRRLAERYGWEPVEEDGRIIALGGRKASITLEPGGQLELSGELCDSVHCARAEFDRPHRRDRHRRRRARHRLPRPRHAADQPGRGDRAGCRSGATASCGPTWPKVGTLGQRMMKQTATVQVNIDYSSEADAMLKMRVGMGITPLLNAMFANSPLCDGDLNGLLVVSRPHLDRHRCRPLRTAAVRLPDQRRLRRLRRVRARRADVLHRARRRWYDMTALTFRQFWTDGYRGLRATMADWSAHLTTLFPEVRLKGYIELRSADSQAPELMLAVPALVKGIFYEADCLQATWDLVKAGAARSAWRSTRPRTVRRCRRASGASSSPRSRASWSRSRSRGCIASASAMPRRRRIDLPRAAGAPGQARALSRRRGHRELDRRVRPGHRPLDRRQRLSDRGVTRRPQRTGLALAVVSAPPPSRYR